MVRSDLCGHCRSCESVCADLALRVGDEGPRIDAGLCTRCMECVAVCPNDVLIDPGQRM